MFAGLNAQVLGVSVDSVPCLTAWAASFGGITYPLLSDFWPHGQVAKLFGVLRGEGYSERAIYILDRAGIIRYIDVHDIANQPNNDELFAELREMEPQTEMKNEREPELPHGGIVMYCTTWCSDCRRARAWLQARGLKYTEVDIAAVPGAAAQVRKWANGKEITPTFDIDGQIVVNFNLPQLEAILGKG